MEDVNRKLDTLATRINDIQSAQKHEQFVLSRTSRITIGATALILGAVVTAVWNYAADKATTRESLLLLQQDVLRLRESVARAEQQWGDRWTRTMAINHARQSNEWLMDWVTQLNDQLAPLGVRAPTPRLPVPGGN